MRCLGIESSCDETAFALVEDGRLKDAVLATQADMHALFGGVVPELASREHYRFCGALYDELMRRTGLTIDDIDVIAVSRGPGLLGSLLVGVAFAKGLALGSGARLLGINHLHAHLLAAGLEGATLFPALGLLVSGGHTHLYRMDGPLPHCPAGAHAGRCRGRGLRQGGQADGSCLPRRQTAGHAGPAGQGGRAPLSPPLSG